MSYTDQDVERVAPRVWAEDYFFCHGAYPDEADPPVRWEDVPEAIRVHARAISRAALEALEAMEREPLEDVIHDLNPGTKIVHIWPLRKGGYEAEIGVPVTEHPDGWWDHERFMGEGATIDEAIRAAVAAANEGYAMIDTGRREPGEGGMK